MCGIAGFITQRNLNEPKAVLNSMIGTLAHRGPDGNSTETYLVGKHLVGFAHARLSVIDISNGGTQPMSYKHFHIVFNGEIYNYAEIKEELYALGHQFKSSSDTEVILHAFEEWNIECVHKFIGMFAFVLADQLHGKTYLLRDRTGVKPLYYYKTNEDLVFASELKAILKYPFFEKNINLASSAQFFKYGYIHAPNSIYEDIHHLEAGRYLVFDHALDKITENTYWSVKQFYQEPKSKISYTDAKEELEQLLISACQYRMVADVPVGVFLSGGYDSSFVAACLKKHYSAGQIKTFTIGFEDPDFNEAQYAKKIAQFLGTDHTEHYCTQKDAMNIIPQLSNYFDEPFFDVSSIPTILLSDFAKKQVTVALSADGGDEIFAGYDIYKRICTYKKSLQKLPRFTKKAASQVLKLAESLSKETNLRKRHNLNAITQLLSSKSNNYAFLLDILSQKMSFKEVEKYFNPDNIHDLFTEFDKSAQISTKFQSHLDEMLMTDYLTYLPNDILTKVDRATMSASLEGREPLLDHRIIEYAAQLPDHYKFDGITQKKILKDITHQYIPKEMMDRPKMGFVLPIKKWLKKDLKGYLLDIYNEQNLNHIGFLNTKLLVERRDAFLAGDDKHFDSVWATLQYISWYNKWG